MVRGSSEDTDSQLYSERTKTEAMDGLDMHGQRIRQGG